MNKIRMSNQTFKLTVTYGCAGLLAAMIICSGIAWAADCGDTADGGSRIACACGDTVVTSTRLRASDPVVVNSCPGNGLIIGEDYITLNCRDNTISGDGIPGDPDNDVGLVLVDRMKVIVKRCELTGFDDGINLTDSSKNVIVWNSSTNNAFDGIELDGDSDSNYIARNNLSGNDEDGLDLDDDADKNVVKANKANDNGQSGIEDCSENTGEGLDGCNENIYLFNEVKRNGFGELNEEPQRSALLVKGTGSVVVGNRGKNNRFTGLEVSGEEGQKNFLSLNVFNRNGDDGICAAVPPNINGGGNRGRNNGGTDVNFVGPCPDDLDP